MVSSNVSQDETTEYLETWAQKVEEKASQQGDVLFFKLTKAEVNRVNFEALIKEKDPRLVLVNNHGTEDSILDFQSTALVKCNQNPEVFRERIAHVLACETGSKLAPACIQAGAAAYIGYTQAFRFVGYGWENKAQDPLASMVLDPAFEAVIALIEGASIEEALRRSQAMTKAILLRLQTTSILDLETRDRASSALLHNLKCQQAFGDITAVF